MIAKQSRAKRKVVISRPPRVLVVNRFSLIPAVKMSITGHLSENILYYSRMQKIISGGNELLDAKQILTQQLGLEPGKVVGDFGCGGAGYFTLAAAKIVGDKGQVYAVDVLKTVLSSVDSKARMHNLYNIKTVWSNLEIYGATDMPEASVDYAFLINILFQSKKHAEITKEVVRLMKTSSKLLVIDWDNTASGFGPAAEDKVDPEGMKKIARDNGLVEVKSFKAGQYHFGIIFSKV